MNHQNLLVENLQKVDETSKREHVVKKPLHGYFYKQMNNDNNIDKQQSLARAKDRFITSDLEGI